MGRPSTLTQDKIDMICQWLHAGYFVEDAARMAKVPKSHSIAGWRKVKNIERLRGHFIYGVSGLIEHARAQAEGISYINQKRSYTRSVAGSSLVDGKSRKMVKISRYKINW